MKKLAIFFLLLAAGNQVVADPVQGQANKGDYQPARGWHFYEIPPEVMEMIDDKIEKEVEKRVSEKMDEKKAEEPAPGSSEWLKINIPKARMAAADEPSTQNIRTLLLMEKIMRDKGRRLAQKAAAVSVVDPVLDGSYRTTSNAHNARKRRDDVAANQVKVFKELIDRQNINFWFFVDENCESCESWFYVLNRITNRYGVKVLFLLPNKNMDLPEPTEEIKDGDWKYLVDSKNAREKLSIRNNEPALFAYSDKTKEYVNIARGFIVTDDVIPRTLKAAEFTGWITTKEAESTEFGIQRHDLANISDEAFDGDYNDLNAYSEFIYQRLLEESDE